MSEMSRLERRYRRLLLAGLVAAAIWRPVRRAY
jgi:hypothetical protein